MKIDEMMIGSTTIKFFDDYVEPTNKKKLDKVITEAMMKTIVILRKEGYNKE